MQHLNGVVFAILCAILPVFGQVKLPIPGYECYKCWGNVGGTKEELLNIVKNSDLRPHYYEGCALDFNNSTMKLESRCKGESRCITKTYSYAHYTVYVRGCSAPEDCRKQPEFAPYEYSAKCCRSNLCNAATPTVYSLNYLAAISTLGLMLNRLLGL